jgi:hypothetical protein
MGECEMTKPNFTEVLNEIKERADKATPGPWKTLLKGTGMYVGNWNNPHHQKEIHCPYGEHIEVDNYNHRFDGSNAEDTADFIAHARSDIPKLLAVIEKLIEQRDSLIEMNDDDEEFVIAGTKSYANAELLKLIRGES